MVLNMKEIGKMAKRKGIFYTKNGNKYEGDFKNNKMDGHGILYLNE